MRICTIICLSALLLSVSCRQFTYDPVIGNMSVYRATVEPFGVHTRTYLKDRYSVVWAEGDRILIFEGNDTGKVFVADAVGSGNTDFNLVENEQIDGSGFVFDEIVAYYPFDAGVTVKQGDEGVILSGVEFPAEQKYVEGSFAFGAFPMVAFSASDESSLSFKNIGGLLRLSVKGKNSLSRITISGSGGELLSGRSDVVFDDGIPSVSMYEDASGSLSLVCDPPVQLSENASKSFYISLPPVVFKDGFVVVFEYEDGSQFVKTATKCNEVKRSTVLSMPVLDLYNSPTPGLCIDLGLSVKWAGWNVGASKPEEYGGYYAWGETEEKESYLKSNYAYYDSQSASYVDIGQEISGTEYDVAAVKWGYGWRMPTSVEIQELIDNCEWRGAVYNGVIGSFITAPNGNKLFVPHAGYYSGKSLYFSEDYPEGHTSYNWSGTLSRVRDRDAYVMSSSDENGGELFEAYWQRAYGLPVRPVKD